MKIVLANLPWNVFLKTGVRAGSRWPHLKGPTERDYLPFPFFLAYAASLLKKHSFDVTLIDAIAEEMSYGYFLKLIHKLKPDILVCETSTVTLNHDIKLLSKIDKGVDIAFCGPDINIREPLFLEKHGFIKYVFAGEYEFTLLDLVTRLKDGGDIKGVQGLIYRDSKDIKANPMRPLADLDKLPWPLREGLPMDRYNDTPGDMPIPSAQIYASRGCPYRCKFCLWPQVMYQGNHYRTRDIVDVVDEMEYLVKEMHFKSIYFDDDTFNVGKERMLRLSNEIKARGLNIPWAIMARADLMDLEILERMRDAGLFAVKYGVESATQEHLDRIDKNMNLRKTEEVIRLTKRLGIKTHLTFTFGLPGETKESIKKTIDMALTLDPVTVQFSIATPFPGTVFYKEMKEKGQIVSENWDEYDGNHKSVVASDSITKKDLEEAIRSAYRQWRVHCARRNPFKKAGYLQLVLKSFKKHGFFITILKIVTYFMRYIIRFFKDKVFYKNEMEQKIKEKGLKIGRLALLSDSSGLNLYWDGVRLTKGGGFASAFSSSQTVFGQLPKQPWNFEKLNDAEILLIRKQDDLGLDEIWKIKVIDEKQIDWDVDILLKNKTESLGARIELILTGRYRTWIDSWGEGRLYPVSDHRKVELRNPNTDFIGLRGRKKLKGQLPTFFLDLSRNRDKYSPSIKNASSILGARVLEVQSKFSNGKGEHSSSAYNLFSMRIKIVEEDFNKRSLNKKK